MARSDKSADGWLCKHALRALHDIRAHKRIGCNQIVGDLHRGAQRSAQRDSLTRGARSRRLARQREVKRYCAAPCVGEALEAAEPREWRAQQQTHDLAQHEELLRVRESEVEV